MNENPINILAFVTNKTLFIRIKNIFQNHHILVHEVESENQLINKIEDLKSNICCIIIDCDQADRRSVEKLHKIRMINNNIPIVVTTFNKNKLFYMDAINCGVNDFIIKPFSDILLYERINKYIDSYKNKNVEIISLDLMQYLNGELEKAEKGNFPLSFMLTTILTEDKNVFFNKMEYNYYLRKYYDEISTLFWNTDIFIRFNSKYYLGVFPFCNINNSEIIKEKINKIYNQLIETEIIPKELKMVTEFASYPENADNLNTLLEVLKSKIKDQVPDVNRAIDLNSTNRLEQTAVI